MPDSLIDIGTVSKPVTKLIEAVKSAVGVIYEPTHIRRVARAKADAALIKAHGDAKVGAFERRVQARITATEVRRQRNIEAIVEGAVKALPAAVSQEPIDPDWVATFFNQSQDIGNETMQSLWSRILAGEVASPGAFSVRTLNALRTLQQEDAELFANACNYAVLNGETPVLVTDGSHRYFKRRDLSNYDLLHLQALGLIQEGLIWIVKRDKAVSFTYGSQKYEIRNPKKDKEWGDVAIETFTQIGVELFPLSNATAAPDYIRALKTLLKKDGLILVEV